MSGNEKLCECGCGQIVKPGNKFIIGHNSKSKIINDWIDKNQGKHFCHCGCNEEITIKKFHYTRGIPKYIIGHHRLNKEDIIKQNKSNKKKIDKFIEENQGKHFCRCGCDEEIIIERRYYNNDIPKYISVTTDYAENNLDEFIIRSPTAPGVVLLFDGSGSMSWRHDGARGRPEEEWRISLAKRAALPFMDELFDHGENQE